MCTTYRAGVDGSQKKTWGSLELDLVLAVSPCVGAGNQAIATSSPIFLPYGLTVAKAAINS